MFNNHFNSNPNHPGFNPNYWNNPGYFPHPGFNPNMYHGTNPKLFPQNGTFPFPAPGMFSDPVAYLDVLKSLLVEQKALLEQQISVIDACRKTFNEPNNDTDQK